MSQTLESRAQMLELQRICREEFIKYKESNRDGKTKLMLAAGSTPCDGWFCTDISPNHHNAIYYCDMTTRFCFDQESFDYIHCEHGIEHITFEDALKCLSECYRVLKKGGVLRIATPSLEKWVAYYTDTTTKYDSQTVQATFTWLDTARQCELYSKCLVFNNAVRNWGHKLIYDFETLHTILTGLKFEQVLSVAVGESEHHELVGMERHFRGTYLQEYNEMETMVLEARK